MRLLILNGPNLNLLGEREPEVYGAATLADAMQEAEATARGLGFTVQHLQSNHEGVLIDAIHAARREVRGIVINPGGFTHTSVALRDALAAVACPVVEIHISNPAARESFRRRSLIAPVATGVISGFGIAGYSLAVQAVWHYVGAVKGPETGNADA